MNHYEKLAIVILRVLGCRAALYALVLPLISLFFYSPQTVIEGMYSSYIYFMLGILLFVLGKPLARLITISIRD